MIRFQFTYLGGQVAQALLFGCLVVGFSVHAQERQFHTWTDLSGSYKVEASFVRINGDSVELQDKLGKPLKVPLSKLSLDSQLQAKKLANPKAFEKPATSASSLAIPTDIGPSPFPPNPTIEQFMDTLIRESKVKNPSVVWHAVPKEMQTEIDSLVVKGVNMAGTSILTQVRSLLGNVGKIVREKKQFILAHPQVVSNPPVASALTDSWKEISAVSDVLTDRSFWAASNFQTGKIGPWFCALQTKLGPPSEALTKKLLELAPPGTPGISAGSLDEMKYKVLSKSADTAQLELTVAGQPPTKVDFKRVGESWLPVQIADQWKEQFAMARAAMDGLSEDKIKETRLLVGATLTTVGGFVSNLANAESQDEFNQVISQIMVLAQQGAGQALGGPPPGLQPGIQQPGNPPAGGQPSRPAKPNFRGDR